MPVIVLHNRILMGAVCKEQHLLLNKHKPKACALGSDKNHDNASERKTERHLPCLKRELLDFKRSRKTTILEINSHAQLAQADFVAVAHDTLLKRL